MRAVHGDAHAAAHADAVDQRDIGLLEAVDLGVQAVLVGEEFGQLLAGLPGLVDFQDVAAGAKRPALGLEDDDLDAAVVLPGRQRRAQRLDHLVRQRVQRLRARQRDDAGLAAPLEPDLIAAAEIHAARIPPDPCRD